MARAGANMMFVTVFAGILDLASGMLVYVNAGHDSPFMLRAGAEPAALPLAGGPPLGTVDDFQYPVEQRQLTPGRCCCSIPTALPRRKIRAGRFIPARGWSVCCASAPTTSAKAVVDFVRDDLRRFAAGAEQADDITLLAVRWIGRVSSS